MTIWEIMKAKVAKKDRLNKAYEKSTGKKAKDTKARKRIDSFVKKLTKMSPTELSRAGYVRVPGFTRKDGTKVKSHFRKLR